MTTYRCVQYHSNLVHPLIGLGFKSGDLGSKTMSSKEIWESPILEDLGDAKDIIQHVSIVGSGDSQFSVLRPS